MNDNWIKIKNIANLFIALNTGMCAIDPFTTTAGIRFTIIMLLFTRAVICMAIFVY